jgi:hypothetical protein
MSAFEITGIVLGSIPLIISALEHYGEGVRTFRRLYQYRWELKSITTELKTEQVLFRNTCEILLDGLADSKVLEELLENPGGNAWRDPVLQRKLERRLHSSYSVYMERVVGMSKALEDFRVELGLDENGTIQWKDGIAIKRAWKIGKFTLSKTSYDKILSRLRAHNSALQELTKQTSLLSRSRLKRGQAQRFKKLRDYSESLYQALQSLNCYCADRHIAALQVFGHMISESRSSCKGSHGEEQSQKEEDDFHITFGSINNTEQARCSTIFLWKEARLQPLQDKADEDSSQPKTTEIQRSLGSKKSVRFASERNPSAQSPIFHSLSFSPTPSKSQLFDICQLLNQGTNLDQHDSYLGSLGDGSLKFHTFLKNHASCSQRALSVISLSEVINSSRTISAPMLRRRDKLALSVAISNAVLRLYHTAWLNSSFRIDDIMLLHQDDVPLFEQVLLCRKMPGVTWQNDRLNTDIPPYIHNQMLFALGIALIEICFSQPMQQLRSQEDYERAGPGTGVCADYVTAARVLKEGRVLEESASLRYEEVVRRCINCMLDPRIRNNDMEDEDFRQAVYDFVVAQLEEEHTEVLRLYE